MTSSGRAATSPNIQNNKLGILLMVATTFVFGVQDAISRVLAADYSVFLIVMLRYWAFAAFVLWVASRAPGGIKATARSKNLKLQVFRGALLAVEICVMVTAFDLLGLVDSHAMFAAYPLMVAAMSGPLLGEYVGPRRRIAIFVGFLGVLLILRPTTGMFQPASMIALCSAFLFALYGILTRKVAAYDNAQTSFFWTGIVGAILMTVLGMPNWEPMLGMDAVLMASLCVSGVLGHWLLIQSYSVAEASAVQPFAFLQLVFASMIGVFVLGEALQWNVAVGAVIVVAAGIFTLLRSAKTTESD